MGDSLASYETNGELVRFEVLGPLRVKDDGMAIRLRRAERRLLSILLLDGGKGVSTDTLIDRMWGSCPPKTARNTLHAHVSSLRRRLPDVVVSTSNGYRLPTDDHQLDLDQFLELGKAARSHLAAGDPEQAVATAQAALRLWRADPFEDLIDGHVFLTERGRLAELKRGTQETLARALIASGELGEAVALLRPLTAQEPLHEPFWEQLVLAYYRSGRQADALRAYAQLTATLADQLGIEPSPRLRNLEERVLLQDPDLGGAGTTGLQPALPHVPTSFVGREGDVSGIQELLDDHRLVSIVGGPGMGKTRLALEIGAIARDRFPAGVWLARLVGAGDELDLAATIGRSVGLADHGNSLSGLMERLSCQPGLLILDNCEHVLDTLRPTLPVAVAGPFRMLATSRVPFGIAGERVWRLGPLAPPRSDEDLDTNPAVRLLVDRARAADPSFDVRSREASDVISLCRRAGGIPLALELAATWLPLVNPDDIPRLEHAHHVGVGATATPHHVSMANAIDRSLSTLSARDRLAFDKAAIFSGSFDADAFDSVCLPERDRPTGIAAIARLTQASLLSPERDGAGLLRYRMLQPLREHGLERLREADLHEATAIRHAAWFGRRAHQVAAAAKGPGEADAFERLDAEIADFRSAMHHSLARNESEAVATMASALLRYWFARYLGWEAMHWLHQALSGDLDIDTRLAALSAAGWAGYLTASYDEAEDSYERCLRLARRAGNKLREAEALYGLARIHLPRRFRDGDSLLRESLALFEEIGADSQAAECRLWIGLAAADEGDTDSAEEFLTDAITELDRLGHRMLVSVGHRYLSLSAWYDGNEAAARHHLGIAESEARATNDKRAIGGVLIQRGLVEGRWGDRGSAAMAIARALHPLPDENDIDFCLVSFGAFPVLIAAERYQLAAQVLEHLDRTYERYGWIPIDVRMPAAAGFRTAIEAGLAGVKPPRPHSYGTRWMRRALSAELMEIARADSATRMSAD